VFELLSEQENDGAHKKFTIVDDCIYSVSDYGDYNEPDSPLPDDMQPDIFETHTYSFQDGALKECNTNASVCITL